jgi:hypothetical protein
MTEEPIKRPMKIKQAGGHEASSQAYDYAKYSLSDLHGEEIWTLAERLDVVMKKQVEEFIAEIRK